MRINLVGAFIRNAPFGTEIAFKKGFEALGEHLVNCIDTSYPGQVWDYNANVTIVFKWMEDYWHDLEMCKGIKIVYQPDDIRFPHIQRMMMNMRKFCDYALTYDEEAAKIALSFGYLDSKKLLLTADPDLYRPVDVEKDIDVCFVGSLTGGENHKSRVKMCQLVSSIPNIKTRFVTDLYDIEQLNLIYNKSKVILNHATDVGQDFGNGYGLQCRHFEAGFTKACLLSNRVIDDTLDLVSFVKFSNELELLMNVRFLLSNPDLIKNMGERLFKELNEKHKPVHRAKEVIDFINKLV